MSDEEIERFWSVWNERSSTIVRAENRNIFRVNTNGVVFCFIIHHLSVAPIETSDDLVHSSDSIRSDDSSLGICANVAVC